VLFADKKAKSRLFKKFGIDRRTKIYRYTRKHDPKEPLEALMGPDGDTVGIMVEFPTSAQAQEYLVKLIDPLVKSAMMETTARRVNKMWAKADGPKAAAAATTEDRIKLVLKKKEDARNRLARRKQEGARKKWGQAAFVVADADSGDDDDTSSGGDMADSSDEEAVDLGVLDPKKTLIKQLAEVRKEISFLEDFLDDFEEVKEREVAAVGRDFDLKMAINRIVIAEAKLELATLSGDDESNAKYERQIDEARTEIAELQEALEAAIEERRLRLVFRA